ncbi:hypothetical protein J4E80_007995 [Alternaria sp. BMP 0032]|nr:hypothetical protein J4E80_007995 [Alternaria sp. BMP 0032]
MMLITKIKLDNQKIVAYKGVNFSNNPFPKLTDNVFPDTATKHAVLCCNARFLPLAYMHLLLKKLIKTKHVDIHEVMVKIKTASRTVLFLADDGTDSENWPEHNISLLRITAIGSRKQWYINLSGAELGLTQAFFTAADFESKHMQALCAVFEFGKCREYIWTCSTMPGWYAHTERISFQASSRMETALLTFLQQPGNDLRNLRKRSIAGSTSWTQPLVEALSQAVHGYISNYNVGGLMSQIINEPEILTREMTRRHFHLASILGDAMTVEENANCPKVTLDLAKIEEQRKGPGVNMAIEDFKSLYSFALSTITTKLLAYFTHEDGNAAQLMAPEGQAETCAVCGEPANNKCSGCKSDTASRQYCGKACQVKDWPTHKKACKDAQNANLEKKLARVAEIVQQAYYDFHENTWSLRIRGIDESDHILTLLAGGLPNESRYFIPFPNHLGMKDCNKKAMLSLWGCEEALIEMHDILASLLKGMCVDVEEISVRLGRVPRKVLVSKSTGGFFENWPTLLHEVIRITATKTKKQWFIDLSGAQYGMSQTLWTRNMYEAEFAAEIAKVQAFGENKARSRYIADLPGNLSLRCSLGGIVVNHLNEVVVKKWKLERALSLADLVSMEDGEYEQASFSLLRTMKEKVSDFTKIHNFKPEFRAWKVSEDKNPGERNRLLDKANAAFFAQAAARKR